MNQKILTIAIPFYNGFETVVSIIKELAGHSNEDYEILISDDCSDSEQSKKLIDFIVEYCNDANIRYNRNFENVGMDLNFQKCIELSKGIYTWFLGQDDFIPKSKIHKIIEYLYKFNPNVSYVNYEIKRTWNYSKNFIHTSNLNVVEGESLKDYIHESRGNVPHFLPSLIVKTSLWPQIKDLEYLFGTYFIQLGAFLQIIAIHKKWLYIGEPMAIGVIPSNGWQSSVEKKIRIYCGFMKCILFTYKKYPQLHILYKQQYSKNKYQHLSLSIEGKLNNSLIEFELLRSAEIFTRPYRLITNTVNITPVILLRVFILCRKLVYVLKNAKSQN